jgi:hypothetical protein
MIALWILTYIPAHKLGALQMVLCLPLNVIDLNVCLCVGNNVIFYYLVCEAISTAATPGLLCQPRVIVKMIVKKQI